MKKIKSLLPLITLLALCLPALTHAQSKDTRPVVLMSGYSDLHHPTSAKNAEAQKFFDQGLRQIYAFNHDEAFRSFNHAAELEPTFAMAYWGVAEAVGPNYNDPADDARFKQAHDAIQKALDLSTPGTAANYATPNERDYILAMAKRFPEPSPNVDMHQAARDYRDVMRELSKKYPDDPDAATLFAEAGMNIHPWGLWHADGTPEEGTEEIVATLESVIRRYPNHMGAIHYYIHAVEASPDPQRALAYAPHLAELAPEAGHLVHMPAHIYIRTGDFGAAVDSNEKAAAADEAYLKTAGDATTYSMMYYGHNLHFIAISGAMNGDYADAHAAAAKLAQHVAPMLKEMPILEGFAIIEPCVDVRFHKWDEILAMPQPDPSATVLSAFYHYARGMAFAGTGKIKDAETEHAALADMGTKISPDLPYGGTSNKAKDVLKIAEDDLGAKIALAKKDPTAAIALLGSAVALQDALHYDEPPDWFFPVRESLGAVLLQTGDAAGAEKVFRDDLSRNPRNPRSLFGLAAALKAQHHDYDAQFIDKQFHSEWKGSPSLSLSDLV
jgi:tetratricopeptide (TPR) repeat protein